MQKTTVLNKILADFAAEHEKSNVDSLKEFCDYAERWLQSAGIAGMGYTADGWALKFSDTAEYLFFPLAPYSFDVGAGVSISGTAERKNTQLSDMASSFQITGR